MDKLLQPESGLMIWTVVTFLLLVLILTKAAWKPILDALDQREGQIRGDLEKAANSQKEAEALRVKYETQLNEAQRSIQDMVSQAKKDSERARSEMITAAKDEASRILEKGKRDLEGETEKLKGQLRGEVAGISVAIAEKLIHRSIDPRVQDEVIKESLKNIAGSN